MKDNQLKAFGIRQEGHNEFVVTNDQVRSLWYLTKRDYDFKLKRMLEAEAYNEQQALDPSLDGLPDKRDLSPLQWQLNNAAYLAYNLGIVYAHSIVLTPEMQAAHTALLEDIRKSVKPIK